MTAATTTYRPMPTMTEADKDRFFAKVPPALPGRCQEMNSCDNGNGYRVISVGNVTYLAHRLAYYLATGTDPGHLTVEHTCRNRACVRPSHLTLLSVADNVMAPTSQGEGARNARKDACHRGHAFTAENTRIQIDAKGRSARVCRTCGRLRDAAKRLAAGMKPRGTKAAVQPAQITTLADLTAFSRALKAQARREGQSLAEVLAARVN